MRGVQKLYERVERIGKAHAVGLAWIIYTKIRRLRRGHHQRLRLANELRVVRAKYPRG